MDVKWSFMILIIMSDLLHVNSAWEDLGGLIGQTTKRP